MLTDGVLLLTPPDHSTPYSAQFENADISRQVSGENNVPKPLVYQSPL